MAIWHLLVVLVVALLLFGSRLPKMMGDLGKGIKNLRDELNTDDTTGKQKQEVLPPEDKK